MSRHTHLATPILFALVTAVTVTGCKRRAPEGVAATRPATQPVVASTTTKPGASVLSISNRQYEFRPARMIVGGLDSGEAGVLVQVFSEGASPEGASDGFYLEMRLDIADASELDGASWQYKATSDERSDEVLSTITVNGGANQLLPKDVTATFREVSADTVEVRLIGFFNVFGGKDGGGASGVVPVQATLLAKRQESR